MMGMYPICKYIQCLCYKFTLWEDVLSLCAAVFPFLVVLIKNTTFEIHFINDNYQ